MKNFTAKVNKLKRKTNQTNQKEENFSQKITHGIENHHIVEIKVLTKNFKNGESNTLSQDHRMGNDEQKGEIV